MYKKTVYIPIEVTKRELDGAILLSLYGKKHNYRTIFGSKEAIFNYLKLKKQKSGIFFYKGGLEKKLCEFINEKCENHVICDQEIGPISNDEIKKKIFNRFYDDTFKFISRYYCCDNEILKNAKKVLAKKRNIKCVLTGWPRVNIWNNKFNKIFNSEIKIISKYKKYNLFSSNFICLNLNELSIFEKRIDKFWSGAFKKEREKIKKKLENNYFEFINFKEFLNSYEKSKNLNKLVIRPHPNENKFIWKEITKTYKKIYVDDRFDIHPWIIKAENIIHRGCTSSFHSKVSNKKTIYWQNSLNKKILRSNISEKISDYIIKDPTELKNLKKCKKKISLKYQKKIKFYQKVNPMEKIFNDFKKLNIKKEDILGISKFEKTKFSLKKIYSDKKKRYLEKLINNNKFIDINIEDIIYKIKCVYKKSFKCKELYKNLIVVE